MADKSSRALIGDDVENLAWDIDRFTRGLAVRLLFDLPPSPRLRGTSGIGGNAHCLSALIRNDVENFTGNINDLTDRFTLRLLFHFWIPKSKGLDGFFVGVLVDHESGAELAVDLNDELDGALDQSGLIVSGPLAFAQHSRSTQTRVDLLRQVRGEGVQDLEEGDEFVQRHDLCLGEGIGADHHLGDKGQFVCPEWHGIKVYFVGFESLQ